MKKKFLILMVLCGVCCLGAMNPVFADNEWDEQICSKLNSSSQQYRDAGCGEDNPGAENVVVGIINVIIGVAGMIAVLMIVVSGINYATSSGDPGKAKKAKDTILYCVIGLIVAFLAFSLVNFVLAGAFQ